MNLWKVWSRLWIVWVFNSVNGMSGVNDVYGFAFALFPAFYMTWLILCWNANNFDIDQRINDERQYGFKMADLYTYCRNDIFNFYRYYLNVCLYSLVPVFVVCMCYFQSERVGATRENGQPYGHDSAGMINIIPLVLTHHIVLIILYNNFDIFFIMFFLLSFQWVWSGAYIDDSSPDNEYGDVYYKSLYAEIFKSPRLWLEILAGVSIAVAPIYAWLKYRQFFGGNPMHDLKYR